MDCEKFDNVMLDELYGELDELTSAAAKRHLSGCARCAAQYAGMKATRRVAVLPLVEPPADLEDRIFARVKEAQKVVPMRARVIRLVSIAGSWAMRPQTAMAAVFLLMIGSSVLFIHARKDVASNAARVSIADEPGAPIPAAQATATASPRELDFGAAASAHGAEVAKPAARAQPAAPIAESASKEDDISGLQQGRLANEPSNAAFAAGAPAATPTTGTPPATKAPEEKKKGELTDLERGMEQYRDKRYDDAVKTLDGIGGSPDAALWSARAVRDSKGCGAATQRFEEISSKAWGTNASYEATMDAAKCYRDLGQSDLARARYAKLLGVPGYGIRAQEELDKMRPASVKPAPAPRQMNEQRSNAY